MRFKHDDIIEIVLLPEKIPCGSTIRRGSGKVYYTLLKSIKVWPVERLRKMGEKPSTITGLFIDSGDGNFNQWDPDKPLVWVATAEEIRERLEFDLGENYDDDK